MLHFTAMRSAARMSHYLYFVCDVRSQLGTLAVVGVDAVFCLVVRSNIGIIAMGKLHLFFSVKPTRRCRKSGCWCQGSYFVWFKMATPIPRRPSFNEDMQGGSRSRRSWPRLRIRGGPSSRTCTVACWTQVGFFIEHGMVARLAGVMCYGFVWFLFRT